MTGHVWEDIRINRWTEKGWPVHQAHCFFCDGDMEYVTIPEERPIDACYLEHFSEWAPVPSCLETASQEPILAA